MADVHGDRVAAAIAIRHITKQTAPAVTVLLGAMKDRDAEIRQQAAKIPTAWPSASLLLEPARNEEFAWADGRFC
jgi:hypothetical protein